MTETANQRLTRENVLQLIRDHGSPEGLDLSGRDLSHINLTGTDLHGIVLAHWDSERNRMVAANLSDATLWATNLSGAYLCGVNFSQADLRDADLPQANLADADFTNAVMSHADLSGANSGGANFYQADLRLANLSQVDLRHANNLKGIRLYQARLDQTHPTRDQLGEAIGDEAAGDYAEARGAYLALKQNFEDIGDYGAASWAYVRERRMEKRAAKRQASRAWQSGEKELAIGLWVKWAGDWLVEILCNYGESVWRVTGWILAIIFVIGPALFSLFGGLSWTGDNLQNYMRLAAPLQQWAYAYLQYVLYTIDTLTTASFSELKPTSDVVRLLSGLIALSGIFLAGLLGFVAGNRIRHS